MSPKNLGQTVAMARLQTSPRKAMGNQFGQRVRGVYGALISAVVLASCQAAPEANGPDNLDAKLPPSPPPNAYLAQLPPETTNQLTKLAIDIAIPTYLPQNMTLANYGVGQPAADPLYYWLVYRDDQNRCFAIEYMSAGINEMSLENQEPLETPLFGEGYSLYHGKFPNGGTGELPESDLFTDWLEGNEGFYRLVGAGLVNSQDYGQKDCNNITIKEAISVTESLSYLPTDIRTLDLTPTPSE
ncbi:hypothetical protein [Leptothoe kymatousa]|uniref:DUF4136 domain-containing protein n=1 Tax=Leptothoe kymatousa TAU-MAC 1615 TaxID=2364775 RepID=A0ABS5Y5L2_9CYAN|nr:hypothetical protein [Leptothoe kymatousa]MBT9313082.1 hypothetical protein [Leptothoe kymatousa TAU-MAC 1615]